MFITKEFKLQNIKNEGGIEEILRRCIIIGCLVAESHKLFALPREESSDNLSIRPSQSSESQAQESGIECSKTGPMIFEQTSILWQIFRPDTKAKSLEKQFKRSEPKCVSLVFNECFVEAQELQVWWLLRVNCQLHFYIGCG